MEDLCNKLKSDLEHYFSMPFEVSSSLIDGEEHYTCSPTNEGAMLFDVNVYIHNHIRLIIEMYPQKHGGYILDEMASAEDYKRKRFSWRTRQTLWGAEQMLTQKHVAKRYMIAKK